MRLLEGSALYCVYTITRVVRVQERWVLYFNVSLDQRVCRRSSQLTRILCRVRSQQLSLNGAVGFEENGDQIKKKKQEDEKEVMNLKVYPSLTIQSLVNICMIMMFGYDLCYFCRTMVSAHSVEFGVKAKIVNIGKSFWIVYM